MPKAKRGGHNKTREKIDVDALISRLNDHVMSDEPVLNATQVTALRTLLNKVLPDVKTAEDGSEDGQDAGPVHSIALVAPEIEPKDNG